MINPVLFCGVISWLTAQILKIVIDVFKRNKVTLNRLVGSGGMPSSHTALVLSVLIAVARKEGVSSTAFAVMFVLASVVIYDAMGVRHAAGLHAKELNRISRLLIKNHATDQTNDNTASKKELTELLGHTPVEVLGGAAVGVIIALIVPIKG